MAKKLLYDYVFDASAQTVTINGHVDLKKLLFINNATRGTNCNVISKITVTRVPPVLKSTICKEILGLRLSYCVDNSWVLLI